MDRKLTIGLLTPGWPGFETSNGIATSVFQLASGLRSIGHKPVILAMNRDGPAPDGFQVVPILPAKWSIRQKIFARLGWWGDIVAASIGESIADAVEAAHATHQLDAVLVEETQGWAYHVTRRSKVPVIVVLHGPWIILEPLQNDGSPENHRRIDRETRGIRSAQGILAPSRNVLKAVKTAISLGAKPCAVVPNAIGAASAVAHIDGGPILFVGRFDKTKGGDTVIKAFEKISHDRPDAQLTFVGPNRGVALNDGTILTLDSALSAISTIARNSITFLGQQSAQQVASLRQTHPIAIIASRYENLNYTMLEAMANGQAIVSTKVGGPAEVFDHERTALLVPPDDPEAMAGAVLRLMADVELAHSIGEAARSEIEDRFHPEVVAQETIDFVLACLKRRS